MPRYVRQNGEAVPISDLPSPPDASGVSFTSSGLTVITGVQNIQDALEAVDTALDERLTSEEAYGSLPRGLIHHAMNSSDGATLSSTFEVWQLGTQSVPVEAGRRYLVTAVAHASHSDASGSVRFRLIHGESNQLGWHRVRSLGDNTSASGVVKGILTYILSPSSNYTSDWRVEADIPNGGGQFRGHSDRHINTFMVEDVGPA